MPAHPWLQQRKTGFYLRAKVPLEIRDEFGKTEVVKSLRTKEPRMALQRVRIEAVKLEQEFSDCRRALAKTSQRAESISDEDLQRIVLIWFHDQERSAATRQRALHFEGKELATALDALRQDAALTKDADDAETQRHVNSEIDAIKAEHGLSIEDGSNQYRLLFELVQRAMIERDKRSIRRLKGDFDNRAFDSLFNGVSPESSRPEAPEFTSKTLGELIDEYENEPSRQHVTDKTRMTYRIISRALGELLGREKPISDISREDCRRVREVLCDLPPNATKRFPHMTIEQASRHAKDEGLERLSPTTIKLYLGHLSAIFGYAAREGYITANPAANLPAPKHKTRKKDRRAPFALAQLKAMFNAPLYTGCQDDEAGYAKKGSNKPRRGRFWVPLLSLYSGMRLNECCQLRTADIQKVDGVDVIRVEEEAGSDKSVKTAAGERIIPVHPELKKVGFLAYVAEKQKAGEEMLFPDLPKGKDGYRSSPFSKWFKRFMDKAGADKERTSFHSFRHTFKDAQREAEIPEDRAEAINGRDDGRNVGQNYGSGFATKTLEKDMKKIKYAGLILSHLYVN